jgi:hypothetical protein
MHPGLRVVAAAGTYFVSPLGRYGDMSKKLLTRMFFLVLVGGLIYGGVDLEADARVRAALTGVAA